MNTNPKKDRNGVSAPKNCRQNLAGSLLLAACALVVATLLFPALAHAQQTPSGDAVAQVGQLRTAVSDVVRHVAGFEQRLETAQACAVGFHRLQVRLPISGAYVVGCFNSPCPEDATIRRAEDTLLRDHRRIGRLEREVTSLRQHQAALEEVVTTFLNCGSRDECLEAASEARERLEDAYNASVALTGWALQQNEWDAAAVLEFQRLEREASTARERISSLENWRRDVVDPKLAELDRRMGVVEQRSTETATTVANNQRDRVRLGPTASALFLGGPGDGAQLIAGQLGVDLVGHPFPSVRGFIGMAYFGTGYGETTSGPSRGVWVSQAQAGIGYEWTGTGRLGVLGGFTLINSTRWAETIMGITGGIHIRGEFDVSRAVAITGDTGWEWGSGVNPTNGVNIDNLSRYQLRVGAAFRF